MLTQITRFPNDLGNKKPIGGCPRCRGPVLEGTCLSCGCDVCSCGRELVAGWCRTCKGAPLALKFRTAGR